MTMMSVTEVRQLVLMPSALLVGVGVSLLQGLPSARGWLPEVSRLPLPLYPPRPSHLNRLQDKG